MGEGPKQVQETSSKSEPWGPTQGLLNSLIGSIGTQFGSPAPEAAGTWSPGMPLSGAPRVGRNGEPLGGSKVNFNVGLTGTESGALDTLTGQAANRDRYAGAIGDLATDLLGGGTDRTGMVTDALDTYKSSLQPYTTMDTNPYTNEAFVKYADQLTGDAGNQVMSRIAGSGYNPAGLGSFGKHVAEGVGRALTPAWMSARDTLEARKLGAIDKMFGGSNIATGLLAGLDQTALGNRMQGINVGNMALAAEEAPAMRLLELEAQRRGIPIKNMAQLESLILPMAQLGGSQQGTTTTETKTPPWQQALGAGMSIAGLLSGNPMGLLSGMGAPGTFSTFGVNPLAGAFSF